MCARKKYPIHHFNKLRHLAESCLPCILMMSNEELLAAIALKHCSELNITGLTCKIYQPCQDVLSAPTKRTIIIVVLLSLHIYIFLNKAARQWLTICTMTIRMYSRVSLHMYVHVRDEIYMHMHCGYLVYQYRVHFRTYYCHGYYESDFKVIQVWSLMYINEMHLCFKLPSFINIKNEPCRPEG
jgi:hypothetical protein